MELSDHISAALHEERRENAKIINWLRVAGVAAFTATVAIVELLSEETRWYEMLAGMAIYLVVAVALVFAGRKNRVALRLSRLAIPLLDMPMVFWIQWNNIDNAAELGRDVQAYSEFTVGVFVILLMLSAFTLNKKYVLSSLVIAVLLEQMLQRSTGITIDGRVFSTLVLVMAAWICVHAGKNRIRLVENVARANARRLRLQRYFSPGVGELLEQWDEDEMAHGQECELTILFIDIRGFTTMSEKMPSREVVDLLNSYHSRMVEAIFRHGGTLDKYLGDGLVAYFNAPVSQEDHAIRAYRCALDMLEGLQHWNEERMREGGNPLRMGIGIHTGMAIVGDIGAPHRREFTAIGSSVNVASRLEGLTKELGHPIVLSAATKALIDEGEWIDLGGHVVRGGTEPIELYAPVVNAEW